ncbi:hypothetical protein NFI96_007511, partial [Prochilodus magdalenae]
MSSCYRLQRRRKNPCFRASVPKMAQQRRHFLRLLRKLELLIQFYSAVIESVLCTSITGWFGMATVQDRNRLRRTMKTAAKITGAPLPSLQDLFCSRSRKRAGNITD